MAGTSEKACHLGNLAPELVDRIFLEIDSTRTLGNFMTTSRYMYQTFKARKATILPRILENELGPVMIDARFLHAFPYKNPVSLENTREHWDYFHSKAALYRDMLGTGDNRRDDTILTLEGLTEVCHERHNINFLASAYIAAQQRSFGGEGPAALPPSRTEHLRVLRAFYRRQIICNAWAPTTREPWWTNKESAAIGNTSNHRGVRLGLFAAFEPWELQQVDHVNFFISQLCSAIRLASEDETLAPQPIGEAEFGNIFSHADQLVRYLRQNPSLAETAIRTLPSVPLLRSEAELHTTPTYRQFTHRYALLCLGFAWQSNRLTTFPDPARDHREQVQPKDGAEAAVVFAGDGLDLPPFGWVDAVEGRYVNWFGDALHCVPGTIVADEADLRDRYITLMLWRDSGFALWDRQRVEAMMGLERLRNLRSGWAVN